MNAVNKLEMMKDASNQEDRKRECEEDIDDCRTKTTGMDSFGQTKRAKGLDRVKDLQNQDWFSPVSMKTPRHCDSHHVNGSSDSSSTTNRTNRMAAKANKSLPNGTKRLRTKSKNEKEFNRIASLRNRQRKKAWQHDLEQMVYTMVNHNQCIKEKNNNLIKLIQDAESYIIKKETDMTDDNCNNSSSPTISTTVTTANPMITTITSENLDHDRTVINHTNVPSHPQIYDCLNDKSSISISNLNCILDNFFSSQRNNISLLLCSNNNQQSVDIQRAFKYYPNKEQNQQNSFSMISPVNSITDANDSSNVLPHNNATVTTTASATTFGEDDFIKNVSYSTILHQLMEQFTQQEPQLLRHSSHVS